MWHIATEPKQLKMHSLLAAVLMHLCFQSMVNLMDDKGSRFSDLMQKCHNNWPDIFWAVAPRFREALELWSRNRKSLLSCPVHGHKKNFSFRPDSFVSDGGCTCFGGCGGFRYGINAIAWANKTDTKQATFDIAQYVYGGVRAALNYSREPPKPKIPDEQRRQYLQWLWDRWCYPIDGRDRRALPVITYFHNRGLGGLYLAPDVLRFHPSLDYWGVVPGGEFKRLGRFPALVAKVTDIHGKLVTLHRTYLTPDGRPLCMDHDNPGKKLMTGIFDGAVYELGASIKLHPHREVMCVAEGIETGLSMRLAFGIPVHIGVSAWVLANMQIPDGVKLLINAGDHDLPDERGIKAGHNADKKLRENVEGRGLRMIPYFPDHILERFKSGKGTDWNHVLLRDGLQGFKPIPELAGFGYPTQPGVIAQKRLSGGIILPPTPMFAS